MYVLRYSEFKESIYGTEDRSYFQDHVVSKIFKTFTINKDLDSPKLRCELNTELNLKKQKLNKF